MNPLRIIIPVLLLLPLLTNANDAPEKVVICTMLETPEIFDSTFTPEDIDPAICTHILYKKVTIHSETHLLVPGRPERDFYDNGGLGFYNRTMKLKEQNPNLKILLQVCCLRHFFWDETQRAFHDDDINSTTISKFAKTVVDYLQVYGFDGISINWNDNDNMAPLMSELRTEFDKHGLILTTFLTSIRNESQDEFRLPTEIAGLVDLMMLGTYWDYTENNTLFFSPLTNMKKYVTAYLEQGFPPEKLVVSIPTLTVTLNLCDGNETGIGVPICPFGRDGKDEPNVEILGYDDVVEMLKNPSERWTVERDEENNMPYAHSENLLWVSFEDPVSVRAKAQYVLEKNLAGVAFMTIDNDDYKGNNEEGIKFPLTRAGYDTLHGN